MVDVVANLDGAEKSRTFGISEEKQVRRHGCRIRLGEFALNDRKEFVEVFSRKELTRRCGCFDITPPMDHVFVRGKMFFVWKF